MQLDMQHGQVGGIGDGLLQLGTLFATAPNCLSIGIWCQAKRRAQVGQVMREDKERSWKENWERSEKGNILNLVLLKKSLTGFFAAPKAGLDIRVVYDATYPMRVEWCFLES